MISIRKLVRIFLASKLWNLGLLFFGAIPISSAASATSQSGLTSQEKSSLGKRMAIVMGFQLNPTQMDSSSGSRWTRVIETPFAHIKRSLRPRIVLSEPDDSTENAPIDLKEDEVMKVKRESVNKRSENLVKRIVLKDQPIVPQKMENTQPVTEQKTVVKTKTKAIHSPRDRLKKRIVLKAEENKEVQISP
ncbi:hypothetical protein O181_055199 [Austropuccinia psidii MF-1]|uniref:Uncharacterized protein n=1 Tax=Austropuccinia psidii MF-1 TaxID=1389203 RepID=A0A9Q3HUD4_9BASI|nr:hypothetical protein [Austropuccinia psidii MF-1]